MYSLIPVCIGIFITVVTDMEINFVGTIFALLAVAANSFYTVFGKTKQNELKAGPQQILLYQSIISAVMLAFCVPFFDDMNKLKQYNLTLNRAVWILISAMCAAGVNFSFFMLVGKTSPLSFVIKFFTFAFSLFFFTKTHIISYFFGSVVSMLLDI